MVHPYFLRRGIYTPLIDKPPSAQLGISVVIPSYNEENLEKSLKSIVSCQKPSCSVEVIVVVNYPENSGKDVVENAELCIRQVEDFQIKYGNSEFKIFPVKAFNLPKKHAGVGLARKIGMDEAAWRLYNSNSDYKIIACFDADATCSENYLVEIEKLWQSFLDTEACSIRYAHPIEGSEFDEIIYNGIAQYELHLRYYILAGKYVGHPFSFHTIGSSMASSADAYLRYGGMNRNKAGEDFYFLQKIIPHGKFRELNSCCVYPSPRPSYRVPFGTGRAMTKFKENSDETYLTYNLDSWLTLKPFFENAGNLYGVGRSGADDFFQKQEKCLQEFLKINNFALAIEEINANTSTPESFQKRFFQWFDAFLLLKYMNFANENYFARQPILGKAQKLAKLIGMPIESESIKDILLTFRKWESNLE